MVLDTILNIDCMQLMKSLPDESIDLVVTDPPYKLVGGGAKGGSFSLAGIRKSDERLRTGKVFAYNDIDFKEWVPEVYRVLKNRSHFYVMVNDRNMSKLREACERSGFKFQRLLVWEKGNVTASKYYMGACEYILLFRKGNAKNINDMGTSNLLKVDNILRVKQHPTEKPVKLMEILIQNSSLENDIVLDPFCGVGPTIQAAIRLKRHYIGCEIDEKYYNRAVQRIDGVSEI